MTVFISYNHKDSEFADRLTLELIRHNIKVWKDSMRIGIGDSLIQKIQEGLEVASYFCVILSHNSIQSEWVKREMTAGLLREIEERRVRILPIVIDDCRIPLLLRDKLYADFREDFDTGFKKLLAVLTPHYGVQTGGQISEQDRYFIHFIGGTRLENGRLICEIDIVSVDLEERFSILTQLHFEGVQGVSYSSLNLTNDNEVTELIFRVCKEEFEARPGRVMLTPNQNNVSHFSIYDTDRNLLFQATCSIKVLGVFLRGATIFNVGALFSQVYNVQFPDEGSKAAPS